MGAASAKRELMSRSSVGRVARSAGSVPRRPLAAEDEVEGGRVGGEAARRAGEAVAFELVHGGAQLAAGEEGAQLGMVV